MKHYRTMKQIERAFFPALYKERLQREFDALTPEEQGHAMAEKAMRNLKRRLKHILKEV